MNDPSKCAHNRLIFGSGAEHIRCGDCSRHWIAIKVGDGPDVWDQDAQNDRPVGDRISAPDYDELREELKAIRDSAPAPWENDP